MSRKKSECYMCEIIRDLAYLVRCYYCRKVYCSEHVDDDYAICPECREDD